MIAWRRDALVASVLRKRDEGLANIRGSCGRKRTADRQTLAGARCHEGISTRWRSWLRSLVRSPALAATNPDPLACARSYKAKPQCRSASSTSPAAGTPSTSREEKAFVITVACSGGAPARSARDSGDTGSPKAGARTNSPTASGVGEA